MLRFASNAGSCFWGCPRRCKDSSSNQAKGKQASNNKPVKSYSFLLLFSNNIHSLTRLSHSFNIKKSGHNGLHLIDLTWNPVVMMMIIIMTWSTPFRWIITPGLHSISIIVTCTHVKRVATRTHFPLANLCDFSLTLKVVVQAFKVITPMKVWMVDRSKYRHQNSHLDKYPEDSLSSVVTWVTTCHANCHLPVKPD